MLTQYPEGIVDHVQHDQHEHDGDKDYDPGQHGSVREFLAESRGVRLDPVRRDEIPGIESFVTPEGFLRTTPADFAFSEPGISGLDGFFAARFVSTA